MGKKSPQDQNQQQNQQSTDWQKSWDWNKNRLPKLVPEAQTYLHQHTIDDSDDRKAHGDFVNQKENHEPLLSLESIQLEIFCCEIGSQKRTVCLLGSFIVSFGEVEPRLKNCMSILCLCAW